MISVALIGADGAGKTTIARNLAASLPVPAKYIYMGVNAEASNVLLPTTRLVRAAKRLLGIRADAGGPLNEETHAAARAGTARRLVLGVKSVLGAWNRWGEEWFRQMVAWSYQRRGYVVLFDRHFFADYYAYDVAQERGRRSLIYRLHGLMLAHVYPKPDLVIHLDAPPAVLLARKGEGTLESLERRSADYRVIREHVKHFAAVDAARPLDEVQRDVAELVCSFHRAATAGKDSRGDARR